eukprot:740755-Rhodomonas_salina.1
MDKRPSLPETIELVAGTLVIDRDRVSFKDGLTTLWSTEKAKFRQWQTRFQLSDGVAATLGQAMP